MSDKMTHSPFEYKGSKFLQEEKRLNNIYNSSAAIYLKKGPKLKLSRQKFLTKESEMKFNTKDSEM